MSVINGRSGAAIGSCERAASTRRGRSCAEEAQGAAIVPLHQRKFGAAPAFLFIFNGAARKFDFKSQILSAPHFNWNRNLRKCENSYIIYM